MTTTTRPDLTDADALLAQRFVDSAYDSAIAAPDNAGILRMVELGLVEEFRPGHFAETPEMRAHGY